VEVTTINRSALTRIGSLVFGVFVLVIFVYFVGVNALEHVLLQVNPSVILIMVLLQILGLIFYSTAWYVLIRASGYTLRFMTCQGVTFASIFVSYTTPSGVFMEAVRCMLGSKESGMKLGESTASVILHRILYVIGFLASTALAVVALLVTGTISRSAVLALAVVPTAAVGGLVILFYLSLSPHRLQPLVERVLRLGQPLIRLVEKEAKVDGKADQFLNDYRTGFRKMLATKFLVVLSFVMSLGDWGCSVVVLWVVLFALHVHVSFWVIMITMAIGKMIQMTPLGVPGMLGIYEAAITGSLSLFAVPVAVAASAALLSRIVTSWLELPITGIAAYHYGFKAIGKRSLAIRVSLTSQS